MLNAIPPERHGFSLRDVAAIILLVLSAACSKTPAPQAAKSPHCVVNSSGAPNRGDSVIFYDAAGAPIKTIQSSNVGKKLDGDDGGWISFHSINMLGCKSGAHALVIRESGKVTDVDDAADRRRISTGTLEFYSANGTLLWTKKLLPYENKDPLDWKISKDDARIIYLSQDLTGGRADYSEPAAMVMLAADGTEKIFRFTQNSALHAMGLSDNGRFAQLSVSELGQPPSQSYFRFYDFKTGNTHDFPGTDGFARISDDGTVEVAVYPEPKRERKVIHRFKFE